MLSTLLLFVLTGKVCLAGSAPLIGNARFQAPTLAPDTVPHTFRYVAREPGHRVNLAGDFNDWNKAATLMRVDSTGKVFTLTVPLSYGRHTYKFVIDSDQWILDPENPQFVDDGNGSKNSALTVMPADYNRVAKLGDGVITASALRHKSGLPDLNYDEGELQFKLRARPNDIEHVSVIVNGVNEIPLQVAGGDDLYAHYVASMNWDRKLNLEYVFKLRDGSVVKYFGPRGLTTSPSDNTYSVNAATFKPFVVPSWVEQSVIYQIFPDRFANGDPTNDGPNVQPWGGQPTYSNRFGGDLAGVSQHASYLQNLGIRCVYFNPIFEGPSNHGYETSDYLKIDHRFGTNAEFDAMTKQLRSLGIRTVLDGVFNHTARGFFAFQDVVKNGASSPYVNWYFFHGFPVRTEDPINYEGWFGYASLPKLNTNNPATRAYLLNIPKFWADQAEIGGWRLDAANEVPDETWVKFRETVKGIDPNLWICGEIWGDASHWLQGNMYDSVMNYRFRDAVLGFLSPGGSGKPTALWSNLMGTYALYVPQVSRNLMNLVDSHDTERLLTEVGHDRAFADLAAILQFSWIGTPSVYYGDELGLDGGKDPDDRRCMPWESANASNPTLRLYQRLIALRNASPELQKGKPVLVQADDTKSILVFARMTKTSGALAILNRSKHPRTVTFLDPLRRKNWREGLTGSFISESPQGMITLTVPGKTGRILLPSSEVDSLRVRTAF